MRNAFTHNGTSLAPSPRSARERTELVYIRLRNLIMQGSYGPDEPLKIRELADELRVSATPVREALVRLCAEEIVVSVPYRGFFVKHLDGEEIVAEYELAFLILNYAMHKSLTDFSADGLTLVDGSSALADFRPGAEEQQARLLADEAEALFERIAVLSGNERMLAVMRGFLNRTRHFRELEFLRATSPETIAANLEALVNELDSANLSAALTRLKQHFQAEVGRLTEALASDIAPAPAIDLAMAPALVEPW